MANKDLVVKMTINSQDFDNGLKNAKTSMGKFQNEAQTMSGVFTTSMKKMAGAFSALGVAMAAKNIFTDFMKSTESMKDSWQNEIGAMKDSWKSFLFQINNGNFQGLKDIVSYARQARAALDSLGDLSALFSLDYGESSAQASELLSTIQRKKRSGEDYSSDVSAYNKIVSDLRADASMANKTATQALTALFGKHGIALGDYGISPHEAARIARMAAGGQYADATALQKAYNARPDISDINDFDIDTSGQSPVERLRQEWGRERFNRAKLIMTLGNITEEEKAGIEKILTDISARDRTISQMERSLNRYLSGEGGGGGGSRVGGNSTSSVGLSLDQQMMYLAAGLQNGILNNDRSLDGALVDIPILDEEIFEPETEALMEKVAEQMKLIQDRTQYAATAMSAFGQAFGYAADLAGDSPFGNAMQALSGVANAAVSTASAMMTLAGVETMEGVAETFATALPFRKLALAGTALAGILSMMAAVKSSFAGSFANGGVVGGTSYSGDHLWARVNSGELIVPYNDWANAGQSNVRFVIEGSQLRGVLDNYDKIKNL